MTPKSVDRHNDISRLLSRKMYLLVIGSVQVNQLQPSQGTILNKTKLQITVEEDSEIQPDYYQEVIRYLYRQQQLDVY